ncbi:glycosyl hydrolase family 8 [Oryzicola mucosus]|uniref:Glucanase n=1 Tax=Oryzicola mucosus TaxID=2767425 RepID=A0A8J6PQ60_9HYPH|nr:glycosyl hydrolase family 8 [Oryzicola mucosus]MBD0416587.1 endoglucanase [Oryzicola mucosus]
MRKTVLACMVAGLVSMSLGWVTHSEAQASISSADWTAYKEKFLDGSGRIVDDANGNISHSEGQGYGMLLAFLANNRGDFDRIWSFTRTELMLRDDGLAVWKWSPDTDPHITDPNNASDGDLLIAYALGMAGNNWNRPDLYQSATAIAQGISKTGLFQNQSRTLLMPGAAGFSAEDRTDGPVVNPSYWVFEAIPIMATLDPKANWSGLTASGLKLLEVAQIGPRKLPPDWLSLSSAPKPANGFPPEFSYNAVRIPLYLLRAGNTDRKLLETLRTGMSGPDGSVELVDLPSGTPVQTLTDPGYRIIPAMISCVLDKTQLADDLKTFKPTSYYPSTLQLLALSFAQRSHPECL